MQQKLLVSLYRVNLAVYCIASISFFLALLCIHTQQLFQKDDSWRHGLDLEVSVCVCVLRVNKRQSGESLFTDMFLTVARIERLKMQVKASFNKQDVCDCHVYYLL